MSNAILNKSAGLISNEIGLLRHISKLPILNGDPRIIGYGIWPSDTLALGGTEYSGRSSGCGYEWQNAIMATLGETVERYCPAFYDRTAFTRCAYKDLEHKAIHPSEYALYHENQYELYAQNNIPVKPFTEDIEIHWTPTLDLTTGEEVYAPCAAIYLPWQEDGHFIVLNTSTGLAGHTDIYKAILTALYETIERDSFVTTWAHQLPVPKIKITREVQDFIDATFPKHFEFHFVDITFDMELPTIFGFCMGETDYGQFIAVGASTRSTYGEALRKTIMEIGQAIPYLRHTLGENRDWEPKNYNEVKSFELHSIFYTKRTDQWPAFDIWRNATPSMEVDLGETRQLSDKEEIRRMLQIFKNKGYNVLFKDLTTVDVAQAGFRAVKLLVPQLVQMSGGYPFYFLGGKRLYETPVNMGYPKRGFAELNKYPHPFP